MYSVINSVMPTLKVRKYRNSVYVIYTHKGKIFKIFTGAKIEDKDWNGSFPKKSCPDYDIIMRQISDMELRVLNASLKLRAMGMDPVVDKVRAEFYAQVKTVKPLWELYDEYLEVKAFKPGTLQKAVVYMKMLKHFCAKTGYTFDIDTWDKLTLGRVIQYLLVDLKYSDSSINRLVHGIKSFLRFAYPNKDLSWMSYKQLPIEEEIVALKEEELKILIEAELEGYLDRARDLFVFLATTGMRFSDSQRFDPSWITPEEILEFNQLKTGGKAMPPLYEVGRRVLDKGGGYPPKITNAKFNKQLKELFRILKLDRPVVMNIVKGKVVHRSVFPLYSVITSHDARRTFITLCLQKGMPIQDVMRMSGHSDYKSMKPYMRVSLKHLRSEADKWDI
jgi:integrase